MKQRNQRTPQQLKTFIRTAAALSGVIAALWLSGCKNTPPKFDGKFWAADSERGSIRRAQENSEITCKDPAFDDYLCMSYADHKRWYETYVLGCERWKRGSPRMSPEEAFNLFVSISEGKLH
jgi:hypothetical protein